MRKGLILFASGLVAIAGGAFLTLRVVKSANHLKTVVVATAPIGAGTQITSNEITTQYLPALSVHPDTLTNPTQAVGQMAGHTILPGGQVRAQDLLTGGALNPYQAMANTAHQKGEAAYWLPIFTYNSGSLAYVGARVNIGVTATLPKGTSFGGGPVFVTAARGVRILAVKGGAVSSGLIGAAPGNQEILVATSVQKWQEIAYLLNSASGKVLLSLNQTGTKTNQAPQAPVTSAAPPAQFAQ